MERVAFLLEETGERLTCMLNPENLVVRRSSGIRPRRSLGGALTGSSLTDDPLFYTGGGTTELQLSLLFDISLAGSSIEVEDVRELTAPLWQLTENIAGSGLYAQPPLARFVWGKRWNIPGIVASVAERLEYFTSEGNPGRSWLKMRFLRVSEPASRVRASQPASHDLSVIPEENTEMQVEPAAPTARTEEAARVHQLGAGERLDELAQRYYGTASLWRWLAVANGISDPMNVAPGTILRVLRPTS